MPKTIAATTKELIVATNEAGEGYSISNIVELIKEEHPGCKTTKACVSWYLSKARKGDFDDVAIMDLPRTRARSTSTPVIVVEPTPVITATPFEAFTTLVIKMSEHELCDNQLKTALTKAQKRADAVELTRLEAEELADAEAAATAEANSIGETDEGAGPVEHDANSADAYNENEPTEAELADLEAELTGEVA